MFHRKPENEFGFGVWLEKFSTPKMSFGAWLEMD